MSIFFLSISTPIFINTHSASSREVIYKYWLELDNRKNDIKMS